MPEKFGANHEQLAAIVSKQHPRAQGNTVTGFVRLNAHGEHVGPGFRHVPLAQPPTGFRTLGEGTDSGKPTDGFKTLPSADTKPGGSPRPDQEQGVVWDGKDARTGGIAAGPQASGEPMSNDGDRNPSDAAHAGAPVTAGTAGFTDAGDEITGPPGGRDTTDREAGDDGYRIHVNADGTIVGRESVKPDINGEDRLIYEAYDLAGNDVLRESFIGDPILEGTHDLLGITYNVAERDDSGKPVKVIGFKTRGAYTDFLKGYAQKLEEEALGPAPETTTDIFPMPDAYHEFVFAYDHRGLVTRIVETEVDEGTETKLLRENYYDASGTRTGYVKSMLEDVTANGGEEYTVKTLILFAHNAQTSRDIEYTEFRDGLMAERVLAREVGKAPSYEDDEYHNDVIYTEESQPYYLALYPQTIELFKTGPITAAPEPIILPTWIPKIAVEQVAQQRISLEEAAAIPSLPEAVGKTIYSVGEAFDEVINYITPEALSGFINRLTQTEQQAVVAFSPSELHRVTQGHTEPLSEQEKVGAAIALHPVFSREEFSENDYNVAMMDALHLKILLGSLDLPFAVLQERAEQLDDYVTPESRKRLEYLVNLEPGDPNAF